MFDDPQRELKRLENSLTSQQDDQWLDEALADAHRLLGDEAPHTRLDETQAFSRNAAPVRNYANGYGRGVNYYEEPCDYDDGYEALEDNELSHKRGIRNLVILALAETIAIVGIIIYWLVKIL